MVPLKQSNNYYVRLCLYVDGNSTKCLNQAGMKRKPPKSWRTSSKHILGDHTNAWSVIRIPRFVSGWFLKSPIRNTNNSNNIGNFQWKRNEITLHPRKTMNFPHFTNFFTIWYETDRCGFPMGDKKTQKSHLTSHLCFVRTESKKGWWKVV